MEDFLRPLVSSLVYVGEPMPERAAWFARHILPLEGQVRASLRRSGWRPDEIEDLVQEAYARLASPSLKRAEISSPADYLFRTVRNIATDQIRRRSIVPIRSVDDVSRLGIADCAPDAEAQLSAHEELALLRAAIDRLPAQCRAVFVLRKIEGLSQAETAQRLGLSQSTVEKHVARGLRLCGSYMTQDDSTVPLVRSNQGLSRGHRRS